MYQIHRLLIDFLFVKYKLLETMINRGISKKIVALIKVVLTDIYAKFMTGKL